MVKSLIAQRLHPLNVNVTKAIKKNAKVEMEFTFGTHNISISQRLCLSYNWEWTKNKKVNKYKISTEQRTESMKHKKEMWRIIGGDKNVWRINFIYGMFYGCKHSRFLALLLSCLIRIFLSFILLFIHEIPFCLLQFFYYHRNQSCLTSTSFKRPR